jgi:hypothetical protein
MILGTHVYPAKGAAGDRMRRALDSWTALPGVRLINLQFAGDPAPVTYPGFETHPVLRQDSRTVSGVDGPRKPIVSELLECLVERAVADGLPYAGFSNADIVVTPSAIERVARGTDEVVIFSRMGLDPETGAAVGEYVSGQDTLFVTPAAFRRLRPRLRPYVVGEMPWDIIYTSIFLTHARAALVNRGDDCRHVDHDIIWLDSPFAPHAWRLAYMDWTYFARWYRYSFPAVEMRRAGAPAAEEDELRDRVFGPLTVRERAATAYRVLRDVWQHRLLRRRR